MENRIWGIILIVSVSLSFACSKKAETKLVPPHQDSTGQLNDSDSTKEDSSSNVQEVPDVKELLSFELVDSINQPHTLGTVQGKITDSTIELDVVEKLDLSDLVANFTFEGDAVRIQSEKQSSGVTKNDFSSPLTYIVQAEDGSKRSYEVKIHYVSPTPKDEVELKLGGNGYKIGSGTGSIKDGGIRDWQSATVHFENFIRLSHSGELRLWLDAASRGTKSELTVKVDGIEHRIEVSPQNDNDLIYAGAWQINKPEGYVNVRIFGKSKEGGYFPNINQLVFDGEATTGKNVRVVPNKSDTYYWGRRGPSVHFNYTVPKGAGTIRWFYSEVTPQTDPVGVFYMAEGFSGGYFGMQVNSAEKRRFIYSLWSSGGTNDPNEVPEDYRVKVLKAGENVSTGKFGNEGSGKNALLNYDWKVGHTYGFLMHVEPNADDGGIYTAYVYIPEKKKWILIAQFDKPKTSTTSLKGLNSFSENFTPNRGVRERYAFYGNQWVFNENGEAYEIVNAKFSGGLTGTRWDQSGGVTEGQFFLRAGGFFDDYIVDSQPFVRPSSGTPPDIDFDNLPDF